MNIYVERLGDAFAVDSIPSQTVNCKCGARLFDVTEELGGFVKLIAKCPRCKSIALVKIKK